MGNWLNVVNARMQAMCGEWRWANALQQGAGVLAKVPSRQAMVELLHRGMLALKYDESLTAGRTRVHAAICQRLLGNELDPKGRE